METLENLPNIVNTVLINIDCQFVWKTASFRGFYHFCRSSSLELMQTFILCWKNKERYCFGKDLCQIVEWMINKNVQIVCCSQGIIFNLHMKGKSLWVQELFNTLIRFPEHCAWVKFWPLSCVQRHSQYLWSGLKMQEGCHKLYQLWVMHTKNYFLHKKMLHLLQVVYSCIKKEGTMHYYIVAIKTFTIRN